MSDVSNEDFARAAAEFMSNTRVKARAETEARMEDARRFASEEPERAAAALRAVMKASGCVECGRYPLTWGDVRFGHPRPGEPEDRRTCGVVRLPGVSTGSFDRATGYQPALARFPGDPTAFVETALGRKKLEDARLREGWVDKADLAADKRHRPKGERSELAKKWAPALAAALKGDTTAPLDRVGDRPEDAAP